MDVIGSNVQINLGITATKNGLKEVKDEVIAITSLLEALSGKTHKIKLSIDPTAKKQLAELASLTSGAGGAFAGGMHQLGGGGRAASGMTAGGIIIPGRTDIKNAIHELRELGQLGVGSAGYTFEAKGAIPRTGYGLPTGQTESARYRSYYKGKDKRTETIEKTNTSYERINGTLLEQLKVLETIVEKDNTRKKKVTETLKTQVDMAALAEKKAIQQMLNRDAIESKQNARRNAELKRRAEFMEKQARTKRLHGFHLLGRDTVSDFSTGERIDLPVIRMARAMSDGTMRVGEFNAAMNKINWKTVADKQALDVLKNKLKSIAQAAKDVNRENKIMAGHQAFQQGTQGAGWKQGATTRYSNAVSGKQGTIETRWRSARKGLAAYQVEVRSFNSLTGEMRTEMKEGAAAAKFLGDSIFRAGEKVLIWTMSTAVLFTFMRAVKSTISNITELEANTIFLARVSDRLVNSVNNEVDAFEQKKKIAREVTQETIKLTLATGGNALEAQRAAAVFLRAGIEQREVVYGVAASLLAAKIAELDVAAAAEMMVSAIRQFNMEAKELIPTLDTLNSLSNNWKVSTDDLLQSISRAGSVFASHNGKISELAALTAVVAQRTSRTGTQIGNAFKTIESRMDRLEVANKLFRQLGIVTTNFDGSAKSLMSTLLELKVRIDQLTDSEQKELTVGIAGVRQRNILVAALEEAVTAHVAHSKALQESGSAYAEFLESSKTTRAALERLKATLFDLSTSSGGGIGTFLKAILNTANGILSLNRILGGWPSRVTLFIASFAAMRYGMSRVITTTNSLGVSILSARLKLNHFRVAGRQAWGMLATLGTSLKTRSFDFKAFGASVGASIQGLSRFATVGNVATVAMMGLIGAYSMWAGAKEREIELLKESQTLRDFEISNHNKRVESLLATSRAVSVLSSEIAKLNRQYREGKIDQGNYDSQTSEVVKDMELLAEAEGLSTTGLDMSKKEDRQKISRMLSDRLSSLFNSQKASLQAEQKVQAGKLASLRQEEKKLADSYKQTGFRGSSFGFSDSNEWSNRSWRSSLAPLKKQELDRLYELTKGQKSMAGSDARFISAAKADSASAILSEAISRETGRIDSGKLSKAQVQDSKDYIASLEKQIEKLDLLSVEYKKVRKEVVDAVAKQKELNDALAKMPEEVTAETREKYDALFESLDTWYESSSKRRQKQKERSGFARALGLPESLAERIAERASLQAELKKHSEELAKFQALHLGVTDKLSDHWIKEFNRVKDEIKSLNAEITRLDAPVIAEFMVSTAGKTSEVMDAYHRNRLEQKQMTRDTMGEINDIAHIDQRMRLSKTRLTEAMGLANGDSMADKLAGRKLAQQELNTLSDLAIEKSVAIADVETKILVTKREQTKEALRALGQLDEEKKLRLLAQAQYFSRNPDAQISTGQLFRMGGTSAGMMGQFWGKHMMKPEDEVPGGLGNFLFNTGIGISYEAQQAGRDYDALMAQIPGGAGGATPSVVARRGAAEAAEYARQAGVVGGDDALIKEGGFTAADKLADIEQIHYHAAPTLNVETNAFDLSPLQESWNKFLKQDVAAEVERLVRANQAVEDTIKPRTFQPVSQ